VESIALPQDAQNIRKLYYLCLVAILFLAVVLRLGDFTERWTGHGWQVRGAFYSIIARNYVEQGYLPLKLGPAMDAFPPENGEWTFYFHQPPLFPLLLSVSFSLFGIAEWSARLLPVVASLIELMLIWAIACRLFGRRVGLVSAALTATVPVTAFYGSHVIHHGSVLMAFSSAAFLFHLKYLDRPSRQSFFGLLILLSCAAMTGWQGYFMGFAILLHGLWCRKGWEALWVFGTLAVLFLLYLLHIYWAAGSLSGGYGGSLADIFARQAWGGIQDLGGLERILSDITHKFFLVFTWPVMVLAIVGLAAVRRSKRPMALFALIVAGLLGHVVFLKAGMRYDYWCIAAAPALFVLAGAGSVLVARAIPSKGVSAAILCGGVVVIAFFGSYQTHKRFEVIDNEYFYRLSCVLKEHTEPDELIGTCEHESSALLFYTRQRIIGLLRDEKLPPEGLPPSLAPMRRIVIPEKKAKPHDHDRILQLLREKYPCQVVPSQECGNIHLFDVTRER
jgi:hypothetical protein